MTSVIVVGKTVKEMRSSGWKDKDFCIPTNQGRVDMIPTLA
jgi:hypothetical protein